MNAIIARIYNGYTMFRDDDIEILIPKKMIRWADHHGMNLENVKIIPSNPDAHSISRRKTPVNYIKKDMTFRIIDRYSSAVKRVHRKIKKASDEVCSLTTLMDVITPEDPDYDITERLLEEAIMEYDMYLSKLKAIESAINDFAYA
ncbi:hypothetical protein NY2A_B314L [Paramecium bursaria Chlorella virus NY2A]|uniref:Uncharacterized protein B314L n=2 Tax=Chlorovirus TaxID=181083 RepID=A7IWI9_PBCVN|nr:hypothetical protein NY2A_B314L [Paramecium bursaria Chlorella virus NY2A]YP_009665334.1 hypothetical protein FK949_gp124 [Paramecium bursaria Chlorella virus NYs1]ABT14713.1 hypothetical protein NY2A_B314L [Paramecium bursaria Chlorella virus NY2A]AGE54834.1 hypothetical protein PBCVMA1D_216L [Paramecium bursaria Chlorella virus MA1D]AGE58689.1 hypothetical protein PBCVNYs1_335L [Paramecium bursaria Chlorella virus NYs1]